MERSVDSPWSRAWDDNYKSWYYWREREATWEAPAVWAAFVNDAGPAECCGRQTEPLADKVHASGSLYAKDTDLDGSDEVSWTCRLQVRSVRSPLAQAVDSRVEGALEDMNSSMSRVNDAESALMRARRRAQLVEAEQRRVCQVRSPLHILHVVALTA